MPRFPRHSGMSLFELLIALAIAGLLAGLAIPAYRSYIDTANMTRVTSNFEQAIRVAQATFRKRDAMMPLGIDVPIPSTTELWIDLLNENGVSAPGGGPAYIASNNKKDTGRGDPETGAIGVQWRKKKVDLRLWRPLYSALVEQRATITSDAVEITIQRSPEVPDDGVDDEE